MVKTRGSCPQFQRYVYRLSFVSILACLYEIVKKPFKLLSIAQGCPTHLKTHSLWRWSWRWHWRQYPWEVSILGSWQPYHFPMSGELGVYTFCSIDEAVDAGDPLYKFPYMMHISITNDYPQNGSKIDMLCCIWKIRSTLSMNRNPSLRIHKTQNNKKRQFLGSNWTFVKDRLYPLRKTPSCHRAPLAQAPRPRC